MRDYPRLTTRTEVLTAVRELLTEETWIRGSFAKSSSGMDVTDRSPDGVCWCARGAIAYVIARSLAFPSLGSLPLADTWELEGGTVRLLGEVIGRATDASQSQSADAMVIWYNDQPDRTLDQIHKMIDLALVEAADA